MKKLAFLQNEKYRRWLYIAAVALLLLAGLLIRVKALRDFRSLWADEACLAINVLDRDFAGLTKPLIYNQAAPLLYLWSVKAASLGLGESETALRLTSWLAGLATLVGSFFLARRFFHRWGVMLMLLLAVTSSSLIRYAVELKQYSSDALISVLLLLAGVAFLRSARRWREVLGLSILGAILVWASHPAIFTLAALGLTWSIVQSKQSMRNSWMKMLVVSLFWLGSFGAYYAFQLAGIRTSNYLQTFWGFGYPQLPLTWNDLYWYLQIPLQLFDVTPATPYLGVAGLFIGLGALSWLRSKDPEVWLFILPPGLTLLAAALRFYPFGQRLVLFLIPAGMILLVKGVTFLVDNLRQGRVLVSAVVLFFVLIFPLSQAADPSLQIFKREELSPLVNYIQDHWQDQDSINVYYGGTCSFRYYARQYRLPTSWYVIGDQDEARAASDRKAYLTAQYQPYAGKPRVWVVFTHEHEWDNDLNDSLAILDQMGTVQFHYAKPGSDLYLYDLSTAAK